jgi:AcrR family transcriptional regulator
MAMSTKEETSTSEVLDPVATERTALETRVLDASLELAIAVGPSWTTLSEVSRRSGVSRATIYRKWPNVEAIFVDVLAREYLTIALQVIAEDAQTHGTTENTPQATPKLDRLVTALQSVATRIRALPLLRSLTDHDPATIVKALFIEANPALDELSEVLAGLLVLHGDDGTVRQDNLKQVATTVVLTVTGFVMTGPILFSDDASLQSALVDAMRRLLRS